MNPEQAWENLKRVFQDFPGPFVLAFSGGIDSRFLAASARILGVDFFACTLWGPHLTPSEIEKAKNWTKKRQITHKFLDFDPLLRKEIRKNPQKRCYFCKKEILKCLRPLSAGIMDGSNKDDFESDRPGIYALQEENVLSPLALAGMDKTLVRHLAGKIGVEDCAQPSRSCLMTRLSPDIDLNCGVLFALRDCEEKLFNRGFCDFRVRIFPEEVGIILNKREKDSFSPVSSEIISYVQERLNKSVSVYFTSCVSGFSPRENI